MYVYIHINTPTHRWAWDGVPSPTEQVRDSHSHSIVVCTKNILKNPQNRLIHPQKSAIHSSQFRTPTLIRLRYIQTSPRYPQRALCVYKRAPQIRKRDVYAHKKRYTSQVSSWLQPLFDHGIYKLAPDIHKRALCVCKSAIHLKSGRDSNSHSIAVYTNEPLDNRSAKELHYVFYGAGSRCT